EVRTSRGFVSAFAWCSSPVARRDCEMVEMACLKISCSCDPDSSRTENLSKLRIRPVSLAPFRRYTTTDVFSRRTVLRKASWMFCGACLPSDMSKTRGKCLGAAQLQSDYNRGWRLTRDWSRCDRKMMIWVLPILRSRQEPIVTPAFLHQSL